MTARRAIVTAAAAAVVSMLAASNVSAQEDPIVIGTQKQFDKLHFTKPRVALELFGQYVGDETNVGSERNEFTEWFFTESLEIITDGYVIHPNFIEFDIEFDGGVSEDFVTFNGEEQSEIGGLYQWDFNATLLRNSKSPLTVYSQRHQDWISRQFGPTLEAIDSNTGAVWDIRSKSLPTRFEASHVENEQISPGDNIDDFTLSRDSFSWHTTAFPGANQILNWDYNYSHIDQTGSVDAAYDTHDAELDHELLFGASREHSFSSNLDFSAQTGDSEYQNLRWEEQLQFEHTEDFETRYTYTLDYYDFESGDRLRQRGMAAFRHTLYDSLITTGRAGVQQVDLGEGGGDSTAFFSNINFDYQKEVPLGTLFLDFDYAYDVEDTSEIGEDVQIIDRPAVFTDAQPIVITGTTIDPTSIVVRDVSGLIIYSPGLDYTVEEFEDRVEISRIIGGQINAGQPVLLDYVLGPQPAVTTTTNSFGFGARYEIEEGIFNGLGVYWRFRKQDQNLDTDNPEAFVPNDSTDYAFGADYRIGDLTFNAERQIHDSSIAPFNATRYSARYVGRPGYDTTASAAAAYTMIDYTDDNRSVDLLTLSATVQHRFTRRFWASATILYRDETDSETGDINGFEQQFELRWQHRQTTAYLQARNSNLDSPSQDNTYQYVQIGIRREF